MGMLSCFVDEFRASAVGRREYPPLTGKSLGIFKADNLVRMYMYDLVINRKFEYFMFFWILMSCGQMMAERPSFARTSLAFRVTTNHLNLLP